MHANTRRHRWSWFLLVLLPVQRVLSVGVLPELQPRSWSVSSDDDLPSSKFTRTAAMAIEDVVFGTDAAGLDRQSKCPLDVSLVWSSTMDVGIFATGAISHLYSEAGSGNTLPGGGGGKQVVVPGFHRELSILDRDGHHVTGSPLLVPTESYFHSSPLLLDWNGDGTKDILWVSVDGEVFVLNGDLTADKIELDEPWKLPKMKFKRDWHKNLAEERPGAEPKFPVESAVTELTPEQRAVQTRSRKLLRTDDDTTFIAPIPAQLDEYHPLAVMRREKSMRRALNRVEKKVAQQRQRRQEIRGSSRKLLQVDGAGLGRINKRRLGRRGNDRPSAATPTSPQKLNEVGPAPDNVASSIQYNLKTESSNNDGDDVAAGGEVPVAGGDEPVQLNAAIGIPIDEEGEDSRERPPPLDREGGRRPISDEELGYNPVQSEPMSDEEAEERYRQSLRLPSNFFEPSPGGNQQQPFIDDQEDLINPPDLGGADLPPAWDIQAEEELFGGIDQAPSSPTEIQYALDELLAEDPDFLEDVGPYAAQRAQELDQQQQQQQRPIGGEAGAAGVPSELASARESYSNVIRELAAKHERHEREIEARQAARQQRKTDAELAQQLETEAEQALTDEHGHAGGDAVHRTGIASIDAELLSQRAAKRRTWIEARNISSNVERILGRADASLAEAALSNNTHAELQSALDSGLLDGLPDEAVESFSLFSDPALIGSNSAKASLGALDPELAWELAELDRLYPVTDTHVWVDAHVLASPLLADLDNDGRPELLVPVSYFFDEADYAARPALRHRLGNLDLKGYVGGALLVFDPWTHALLWEEHLDQSTARTQAQAHLYATPTVVDLEGKGEPDVLIATAMGFIYAFNARTHALARNFPLVMNEIQAPLAVGDIDQDGTLEIVAVDLKGNVFAFDHAGTEKWSTLISGYSSAGAVMGDVDGDGTIDVAIGTLSGHLWVLSGKDGKSLPKFPLRTDGRIVAPLTLTSLYSEVTTSDMLLSPRSSARVRRGLHIVFPSFDGHVYLVEGRTGCATKLDIGEHVYAQVLTDDVLGRGKLDLIVSTMSGNVYAFTTESRVDLHPLRAVASSHAQGGAGFMYREHYHGISLTPHSRELLSDVSGPTVEVEYTIVDERAKLRLAMMGSLNAGLAEMGGRGADPSAVQNNKKFKVRYEVSFFFGVQMVHSTVHVRPGVYTVSLPTTLVPAYLTLEVRMINEHAELYRDEAVAALNVHFYRTIKYLAVIPFVAMCALLILMQPPRQSLP